MAIPFLNSITLNNNEIQNVRLQNAGSPPLNFGPGQIYFDSTQLPTIVDTAKYYANSIDTWVSLKEYSFPTGNYVTGAVTGTTPKPVITFDLNAADGDAAATAEGNGIRYLSKNNKWAEISTIPGTYKFTISDNTSPTPVTGIVAEDDTVQIAANADLTSNLTGESSTSKVLTVGLKVDSGLGNANNYVLNQGTEVATADDTIPFNDYTPGATPPSTQTNIVKKTTFGTIPVTALTEVKTYIDNAVAGGLIYQGGFDGSTGQVTGTADYLDDRGTQIAVNKGWTYTVTASGTFYGENVEVGDVLIAEDNLASGTGLLSDWTTVQNNVDLASLLQVGIGNVNAGTGINVSYLNGTATVSTTATSATGTITAGSLLGTVNHNFGINTIVQTIDATGATVFCDITRTATTVVATVAAAQASDITILVQKIG
jgi:hypothetical protein